MVLTYFPDKLKMSKVITIQKPGAPQISLLHRGKTLERLILKRLKYHNANWFSEMQFGFNSHHSTELANFNLLYRIQHTLAQRGKGLALISLDMIGAFDRARHTAILHALHTKQRPTYLLKLIHSLLTNRTAHMLDNKGKQTHSL